ncbi:hypothetical protein AB4Z14_13695 [Terrabacter sp. 2TAF16]|uniref:hypothetical protein n=1 Tax=Terrabacter sp. 2TAF16 TaxID=3233008 RepID=UPI003F9EB255
MSAATWFGVVGIAFNLVGALLSGWALVQDARANDHALARALAGAKRGFIWYRNPRRWRRRRIVRLDGVELNAGGVAIATAVDGDWAPPNDDIERMQFEISNLKARLDGVSRRQGGMQKQLFDLRTTLRQEGRALRAEVKNAAVGSLTVQLWGVVMVAIGSVLSAAAVLLTQ